MAARTSGTPADALLLAESVRMSERCSFSSTKNGPSVSSGVTTQLIVREAPAVAAGLYLVPKVIE